MTLFETTQTITGWIRSCTTADQLDLCKDIVVDYVVNRFSRPDIDPVDLINAKMDLGELIDERRIILASTQPEKSQ